MFLLLQQNEGGEALWIWLVVILIPVLGRIAGWVLERMGGPVSQSGEERAEQRQARTEARRERAKELERRGQEMWKRLLEGGEAPEEPTPPAAAPPVARPRPATPVRQVDPTPLSPGTLSPGSLSPGTLPHEELPSESAVPTLERKLVRALPSASMPELPDLPQHLRSDIQAERDLRADEELLETGRVDYLESLRERSEVGAGDARQAVPPPQRAADWRRAVLWSEIIGSPVALRDGLERDLPAFR